MNTFKKIVSSFLGISLLTIQCQPIYADGVKENELIQPSMQSRKTYGSNYWTTSNIREWLNTDKSYIKYTNQAPSSDKLGNFAYDKEPGFLSNFNVEEQDAIAVTKHRVYVSTTDAQSGMKDGGNTSQSDVAYPNQSMTFSLNGLLNNNKNFFYKMENDKVFFLNAYEAYSFLQKRGWSLPKELTPEAQKKHSYYNNYEHWMLSGGRANIGYDLTFLITPDSSRSLVFGYTNRLGGVVPAIHIKPDYKFPNGKIAKDIQVGEKLLFGNYNGAPIEWKVVNKTEEGFPLLLSEKIIDLKHYDAPGDEAYKYSEVVDFQKEDVNIVEEPYRNINNSKDVTPPDFKILNEDKLNKRSNDEFTLELEASDESDIEYVILPNGNKVYNKRVSYTMSENKEYLFIAKDKVGNFRYFVIPVGNINIPPKVIINPSANGWTNKDVTVDISASNDVGSAFAEKIQNNRDRTEAMWPNYTTYKGKRIRISGDVEFIEAKKPVGDYFTGMGFVFTSVNKSGSEYNLQKNYHLPIRYSLKELQEKKKAHFDHVFTVPDYYYKDLIPWSQINVDGQDTNYKVKWTNVKYELLDKDDFAIEKIILPSGNSIGEKSYKDTLTKEGNYTYQVLDNRGMITKKDVEVKIDKTLPTIQVDGISDKWTNQDVKLNVTVSDSQSGVAKTILPNGSETTSSSFEFVAKTNGDYQFQTYDKAGNVAVKKVAIRNIDKLQPYHHIQSSFLLDEKHNVDKSGREIRVIAKDDESGVDSIQLPSGEWVQGDTVKINVYENGEYPFKLKDNAGNIKEITSKISDLEKISISGIQKIEYKLDGAENKGWTNYTEPFFVKKEGLTTITSRAYDKAGNVSSEKSKVVKLDKTKPINNGILITLE
ncbi:hypothetical protein CN384_06630 [Bacillus thuringiensis]|uniref:OmpL47-type beta-barrel domain-containing protein n=1 Tax=Bacillus thuringiensis TaxID=1428 RepID=UPI000BF7A56E|nr:DUF6273 domain-containing protein [Bacillus thuringiensis]PFA29378.1 hypothetical protein CN384_06630 [Bacillus thuringiensis]